MVGYGKKSSISIEENDWFNPFDACLFFGDLNYRLDLPRLEIESFHDLWKETILMQSITSGQQEEVNIPFFA